MSDANSCCCQNCEEESNGPKIETTDSKLRWKDNLGGILARLGIRNNYQVKPGLYKIGNPDNSSPILVTANYKLTFDHLRKNLSGRNAWILVLDTRGINVWCAAGKGTFGTKELVNRIKTVGLDKVTSQKTIILPQLGATGVSAHIGARETGYIFKYGPVKAEDIGQFLDNGLKKTDYMRKIEFNLKDRLVLIPIELKDGIKYLFILLLVLSLPILIFFPKMVPLLIFFAISLTGGVIAGAVLFPALLPVIPFKPFSIKGALLGLVWSAFVIIIFKLDLIDSIAASLFLTALVSFIALNFTGSTPFTTLSGVKKEVGIALPIIIISFLAGMTAKILTAFKVI